MKRISSRLTFVVKRILPVAWVAATVVIAAITLTGPTSDIPLFERLFPYIISVLGLAFLVFHSYGLMDEVVDSGGHLIVRRGGEEEHIPIASIINVNYQPREAYSRITLRLERPCRFGNDIAFLPTGKLSLNPYSSDVADDLIARTDRARRLKGRT